MNTQPLPKVRVATNDGFGVKVEQHWYNGLYARVEASYGSIHFMTIKFDNGLEANDNGYQCYWQPLPMFNMNDCIKCIPAFSQVPYHQMSEFITYAAGEVLARVKRDNCSGETVDRVANMVQRCVNLAS